MTVKYHGPILAALVGAAMAAPALAADLYNNGPYITHPNAPHTTLGTANVSQLQNITLGDTTLGFTVSPGFRLADDFTIPSGQNWTISSVAVYAYSTNFVTPPSGANLRIWSGDPGAGGALVYDGSGASTLLSATFDALRIAASVNAGPPFSDAARRVFNVEIGVPNVNLGSGQYWVDWQVNPTAGATSAFNPPVTIHNQGNTAAGGVARQWTGTAWTAQLTQGTSLNPVDLPFVVKGTPEPSTLALLLIAGGSLLSLRRR